jgi:transcriptional regulator with XRE-family HTH domain
MRSNISELVNRELLLREFGILLAGERRRRNVSQAQLAARAGLSRTSITNIERGRQPIQLYQLYLFASLLQVEVAKLLPKEATVVEAAAQRATDKEAQYIADAIRVLTRPSRKQREANHDRES